MTENEIDADEALNQMFTIIREEASRDPRFARRLLDAMNVNVIFRGEEAVKSVDPVLIASKGYEYFSETFRTFKAAQLKKMLKDYGLATTQDMKGKTKVPQLVELMWRGAQAKLEDIAPSARRWR